MSPSERAWSLVIVLGGTAALALCLCVIVLFLSMVAP